MAKINSLAALEEATAAVAAQIGKRIDWSKATAILEKAGGIPSEENFHIWRDSLRRTTAGSAVFDAIKKAFGIYEDTVFQSEPWLLDEHQAQVDQEDKMMVAWFDTPEKRKRDITTKSTVGKYLTKYYLDAIKNTVTDGDISEFRQKMRTKERNMGLSAKVRDYDKVDDDEIKKIIATEKVKVWADRWREKLEEGTVHFACTPDECERVYLEGPQSCMSGNKKTTFMPNTGNIYPTRVYGGPDTVVAYTTRNGKINARVVCSIKDGRKPLFGRVFGDSMIADRLKAMGFKQADAVLDGCRLLKIPVGNGAPNYKDGDRYVMPYLDGAACYGKIVDGYIVIGKNGDANCQTQYGSVQLEDPNNQPVCQSCGKKHSTKNSYPGYHGRICHSCATDRNKFLFVWAVPEEGGDGHEMYCPKDEVVNIDGTRFHVDDQTFRRWEIVKDYRGEYQRVNNCRTMADGKYIRSDESTVVFDFNKKAVGAAPTDMGGLYVFGNAYNLYITTITTPPEGYNGIFAPLGEFVKFVKKEVVGNRTKDNLIRSMFGGSSRHGDAMTAVLSSSV